MSSLGKLLPSLLSSLICNWKILAESMPRQTKRQLKRDLNFMTIHIPIKFKEHNYSQQGKAPEFSFSLTIHITPVARMMSK
jgi:hypothetical protein